MILLTSLSTVTAGMISVGSVFKVLVASNTTQHAVSYRYHSRKSAVIPGIVVTPSGHLIFRSQFWTNIPGYLGRLMRTSS